LGLTCFLALSSKPFFCLRFALAKSSSFRLGEIS
jgi:hypothetical protein